MKTKKQPKLALSKEVSDRTVGYLVAALGLVAGLAWNEFVKALIEVLFPFESAGLWAKAVYAVILTAIVVVLTTWLTRISSKK